MIHKLAITEDFSLAAAEFLYKKMKSYERISSRKINIALSGGNTPLPILELLKVKDLDWRNFAFFMVDERDVPINHSQSNFGNISKAFYDHIPSSKYSIVQEGCTLEDSVNRYSNTVRENVPGCDTGFPIFDLIILGMGDDGHTASLFPNTEALFEEKKIIVINEVPQLKARRITLTYPILLNARELVLLAKGATKLKIFEEVKAGEKDYPISKIAERHSNLNWIIQ